MIKKCFTGPISRNKTNFSWSHVYKRLMENIVDMLFEYPNSYYQNIKLTIELNPSKFLDTELIREKGSILTPVFN